MELVEVYQEEDMEEVALVLGKNVKNFLFLSVILNLFEILYNNIKVNINIIKHKTLFYSNY